MIKSYWGRNFTSKELLVHLKLTTLVTELMAHDNVTVSSSLIKIKVAGVDRQEYSERETMQKSIENESEGGCSIYWL